MPASSLRHGYVVAERRFNGTTAQTAGSAQSAMKRVTALLAGIVVDRGLIAAEPRVFDVLPE